jgi:hypothetical protein
MGTKQRDERLCVEWLAQVPALSPAPSAISEHVVVGRDEDDRWRGALRLEPVSKIEAAHPTKMDVENDAFRAAARVAVEEFLRGAEGLDRNSVDAKGARERGT